MQLIIAKEWRLEAQVRAVREDCGVPHEARARINELIAERGSLNAGNEKAKAERDTLPTRISELGFMQRNVTDRWAWWCRLGGY